MMPSDRMELGAAEEQVGPGGATPEEPRVGVFICHCGRNIGSVVDVPKVVESASNLPDVVHAEENLYSCSEDGLQSIKAAIREHGINRVVVASCTPIEGRATAYVCVNRSCQRPVTDANEMLALLNPKPP